MLKVRAEQVLREALLPQARDEEMSAKGKMGINALQDIHQVDVGVDALQATQRQPALYDAKHRRLEPVPQC